MLYRARWCTAEHYCVRGTTNIYGPKYLWCEISKAELSLIRRLYRSKCKLKVEENQKLREDWVSKEKFEKIMTVDSLSLENIDEFVNDENKIVRQ